MRGTNLLVVFFARVHVVIHAIDTTSLQSAGLIFVQQAEAGADFEIKVFFDFGHNAFDRRHLIFARTSSRYHDAVSFGILFGGDPSSIEQLLTIENVVLGNFCFRDLRLATVTAVFGAEAALGIHQKVKLDGILKIRATHTIRRSHHIQQFVIG